MLTLSEIWKHPPREGDHAPAATLQLRVTKAGVMITDPVLAVRLEIGANGQLQIMPQNTLWDSGVRTAEARLKVRPGLTRTLLELGTQLGHEVFVRQTASQHPDGSAPQRHVHERLMIVHPVAGQLLYQRSFDHAQPDRVTCTLEQNKKLVNLRRFEYRQFNFTRLPGAHDHIFPACCPTEPYIFALEGYFRALPVPHNVRSLQRPPAGKPDRQSGPR